MRPKNSASRGRLSASLARSNSVPCHAQAIRGSGSTAEAWPDARARVAPPRMRAWLSHAQSMPSCGRAAGHRERPPVDRPQRLRRTAAPTASSSTIRPPLDADRPAGVLPGEARLMQGHDQGRAAALAGRWSSRPRMSSVKRRIEVADRLVGQDHLRLLRQHAGDRDPLALAAAQRIGALRQPAPAGRPRATAAAATLAVLGRRNGRAATATDGHGPGGRYSTLSNTLARSTRAKS